MAVFGMNAFSPSGFAMNFAQSGSFRDAAQMNQDLYRNIQAAHANRIAQASAAQQQVQAGYSSLSNAVLRRLAGSNRANIRDISDKFTAASGRGQLALIARGLGNTSILGDLVRGIASDRAKEVTRSRNEFAQLMAATQSRIGLAGLDARMQGIGMLSGLQGDQISSLERVSAPYPQDDGGGGMPAMPGQSPGLGRPTGGYIPQGLFAPSYGGIDFGGGGGGPVDPSFYGGMAMGADPWGAYNQQLEANQIAAASPYQPGLGAVAGGLSFLNHPG